MGCRTLAAALAVLLLVLHAAPVRGAIACDEVQEVLDSLVWESGHVPACSESANVLVLDGVSGRPHGRLEGVIVVRIRVSEGKTLDMTDVGVDTLVQAVVSGDMVNHGAPWELSDVELSNMSIEDAYDVLDGMETHVVTLNHVTFGEVFDMPPDVIKIVLSHAVHLKRLRVNYTDLALDVISVEDSTDFEAIDIEDGVSLHELHLARLPKLTALPEHIDGVVRFTISELPIKSVRLPESVVNFYIGDSDVERVENEFLPVGVQVAGFDGNHRLREIPPLRPYSSLFMLIVAHSGVEYIGDFAPNNNVMFCMLRNNSLAAPPNGLNPDMIIHLDLSSNNLTKVADYAEFNRLVHLDVSHNQLTELSVPPHLSILRANNNRLRSLGDLPATMDELHLAHNELTELPAVESTKLTTLDVSHNRLQRILGVQMPNSLDTVSLQHNNLTTLPAFVSSYDGEWETALTFVDLSHNRLRDVPFNLQAPATRLETLAVQHNELTDWAPFGALLEGAVSVRTLDFSFNHLSLAPGGAFLPPLSQCHSVSLVSNRFSGPLPRLAPTVTHTLLMLRDSGFSAREACARTPHGDRTCLGGLVEGRMEVVPGGRIICPTLTVPGWIVDVDAHTYYNTEDVCHCVFGFVRDRNNKCVVAPEHSIAPGGILESTVLARRGYWASEQCTGSAESPAHVDERIFQPCPRSHRAVCSPETTLDAFAGEGVITSTDAFPQCAEGYTGRKCTKCVDGYAHVSTRCFACPPGGARAAHLLWYVLVWAALLGAVFTLRLRVFVLLLIAIWCGQFVALISEVEVDANAAVRGYALVLDPLLIRMPYLDCYSSRGAARMDMHERVKREAVHVGMTFCVVLLVWIAGRFKAEDVHEWGKRCAAAQLMLLLVLYVPVAYTLFSAVPCEVDPCTERAYFAREPYLLCDTPRATSTHALAYALMAVYTVLFPLVFAAGDRMLNRRLLRTWGEAMEAMGDVLRDGACARWALTGSLWFCGAVAMFLGMSVDADSITDPLVAASLFFVGAVASNIVQPFREPLHNSMQYVVLLALSLTYIGTIAMFSVHMAQSVPLATLLLAVMVSGTLGSFGSVAVFLRKRVGLRTAL